MSQSLALPWEVIERVIDHSANSTVTLYSFTLTCRQLRPRSTILLLCHVQFKNRDQLFALCAVLQARPDFKPYVRSVSIPAPEFCPHPLLRMLPNLSEIEFPYSLEFSRRPLTLHPSTLKYCSLFGENIQTLSLMGLEFTSLSAFSGILLAFPRLLSLSCHELGILPNDGAHQDLIKRRLSERLHLDTLTISESQEHTPGLILILEVVKQTPLIWLLEVVKHTLTRLELKLPNESREVLETSLLASPSDWMHLSSFTWHMYHRSGAVKADAWIQTIKILNDFRPAKLREVTVNFVFEGSFGEVLVDVLPSASELCAELEKTLLTFPQPTISCSSPCPLNIRSSHSWMRMLGKFFPALAECHALTINAESSGHAGHDWVLRTPIVTSADSRWAATGSDDGTIIIWDLESGCISQEWFAGDTGVDSLAFSPDGRYIMSASGEAAARGTGATIWDLHHNARKVRSLMEEDGGPRLYRVLCAWSPDGTWIAAGPQGDGTVHIWETTTFQRLHFHATWLKGELLAFSADGCWVVTADRFGDPLNDCGACWIWNVESGKLDRSLRGHIRSVRTAAFDSGSMRIVTGSEDSTIRIWDVETGEELLVLEQQAGRQVKHVAFSPDGKLVLSSSESSINTDSATRDRSGAVKIWDASSGVLLACLCENAPDDVFESNGITFYYSYRYPACFSPCGRYVATGSYEGAVFLWRTTDWSCAAKISEGKGTVTQVSENEVSLVTHVAISPDGRFLCWGTVEGMVFFRRMSDLVPTLTIR